MKQAGRARGAEGVLLLHAWWGLTDDVSAYAERLAGEGFAVRAPRHCRAPSLQPVGCAPQISVPLRPRARSESIA